LAKEQAKLAAQHTQSVATGVPVIGARAIQPEGTFASTPNGEDYVVLGGTNVRLMGKPAWVQELEDMGF